MDIRITLLLTKQTRQQMDGYDVQAVVQRNGYQVMQGENKATEFTVIYPSAYRSQKRWVYMRNAVGGFAMIEFPQGEDTVNFTLPDTMTHAGNTSLVFNAENEAKTVWQPVIVPILATGVDYRAIAMASPDLLRQAVADSSAALEIINNISAQAETGETTNANVETLPDGNLRINIEIKPVEGEQGEQGEQGNGIASTEISYQVGTSGTVSPIGTWTATIPIVPQGQFLWTRTVFIYTDETTATAYTAARQGMDGNGAGNTTVYTDNVLQHRVDFTSDPQTQITAIANKPIENLELRPMTPDLHDWIPFGSEGMFVGEGLGIANAPSLNWWRYIGISHHATEGFISIIAIPFFREEHISPNRLLMKNCTAGIWSNWSEKANLDDVLQLSGGTMRGPLTIGGGSAIGTFSSGVEFFDFITSGVGHYFSNDIRVQQNIETVTGNIFEKGQRVYSPNNPAYQKVYEGIGNFTLQNGYRYLVSSPNGYLKIKDKEFNSWCELTVLSNGYSFGVLNQRVGEEYTRGLSFNIAQYPLLEAKGSIMYVTATKLQ